MIILVFRANNLLISQEINKPSIGGNIYGVNRKKDLSKFSCQQILILVQIDRL